MKKKVVILGSTGSIGKNAIGVLTKREVSEKYETVGLGCFSNYDLILSQAEKISASFIAVLNNNRKIDSKDSKAQLLSGKDSFFTLLEKTKPDLLINSVSGLAGLKYTVKAVEMGIDVALANKESLVMGGEFLLELAQKQGVKLIPVDSEHSAIYQLYCGRLKEVIKKIYITGSGGPFLNRDFCDFESITPDEALKHPNWKMGKKITIDSATLMNKGLELIEAYYLFGLKKNEIEVIIHPESIIHGMVEMIDGSVFAQMANPDMKGPISYALTGEKRVSGLMSFVDFKKVKSLTFYPTDLEKFPLLRLAGEVLGSNAKTISMNTANEIAVNSFLENKISFMDIYKKTLFCVEKFGNTSVCSFDDVYNLSNEVETFLKKELSC